MSPLPEKVVVHPLVLLSVVDHYYRVAKDTKKRVVGVLLGSTRGGILDVSNSFAVPFEEDEKNPNVWYLDHNYMENMYAMFRKVNAKEKLIGWYHTGPKLGKNDLLINDLMAKYTPNPCLCIIDVKPKELGLPTDAYVAVEEIHDDGTPTSKTFEHVPSEMGAEEAEEIGVEHLLRDIMDSTQGTVATRISNQLNSVRGLKSHLEGIYHYLEDVAAGKLPVNNQIVYVLQDIFNLLPDLNVDELVRAFAVKTNDQMMVIYLSSLIRAIIALHDLINNKIANREAERAAESYGFEKPKKVDEDDKEKVDTDVVVKDTA